MLSPSFRCVASHVASAASCRSAAFVGSAVAASLESIAQRASQQTLCQKEQCRFVRMGHVSKRHPIVGRAKQCVRLAFCTTSKGASAIDLNDVDPLRLLSDLKASPGKLVVTGSVAEALANAMAEMLKDLQSPVVDICMPSAVSACGAEDDVRIVVVGDTHGQLLDVLHIFETQGPPSDTTLYVFNGDIVDRGHFAVEILLLLIAFKLRYPSNVFFLRGNHENDQMIKRPYKMGGGFAEECLQKYDRTLLDAFRRVFKLLPLFAVLEKEVFVVHGGLFRAPGVTLDRLRAMPPVSWQRNYPDAPSDKGGPGPGPVDTGWSVEEEIIFDAQWADPHYGSGSRRSSRGRVAVTFGEDVTHAFLDQAGLALCIRSHRVPQGGHGFELEHGGRLLTVFSASRYGGVLSNRGAVAVFHPAKANQSGGKFSRSTRLKRLRLSVVEHDIAPSKEWRSQEARFRARERRPET